MTAKVCALALVAPVVALGGCGGGDGGDSTTVIKDGTTVIVKGKEAVKNLKAANVRSQDSDAKSDARNMVSNVEACFTDTQDYSGCQTAEQLGNTGLRIGSGPGQVEVAEAAGETYTITAHSKTGNIFTIEKSTDGTLARTCTTAGKSGCQADGTW